MILYEFEVKELLEEAGVPVERSCLVKSVAEARRCTETLRPPFMLKAQVRGWGRGKKGFVKKAVNVDELESGVSELLGKRYGGVEIRYVLVSEYVEHQKELYLSFMADGDSRRHLMLASVSGGVDVEESGEILEVELSPALGFRPYLGRWLAAFWDVDWRDALGLAGRLYEVFLKYKLRLLEVNPIAVTSEGLVAIDRKAIVDDDAVSGTRLEEFWKRYLDELQPIERKAVENGLSFVMLDGEIGVIGNGAGLTMATMDIVSEMGGRPAFFLDVGGGASSERVKLAVETAFQLPNVKAVIVNILGGITRCDEVARGLLSAIGEDDTLKEKLFVRLAGLNEEEGNYILKEAGVPVFNEPLELIKRAVEYVYSDRT